MPITEAVGGKSARAKKGPSPALAVSKKTMRVTKEFSVGVGLFLVSVGVGWYVFAPRGALVHRSSGCSYEVQYHWDRGIKSLRITDARTGAEERDPKWRARVQDEAARVLPNLIRWAGLERATGRFLITFRGYEEPYLPVVAASTSDPDLVRDPDFTPLMSALYHGDMAKARELIAAGTDVNAADQHGLTALMLAAGRGDADVVQALLRSGADANAKNKDGETALFMAAFLGRLAAVRELLRNGADVNVASRQGVTALMGAAQQQLPVVRTLLAHRASVNAKNVLGETPLMMAARAGRADITKVLLNAGADVNAQDRSGRTALSLANRENHAEIAQLLEQLGARE